MPLPSGPAASLLPARPNARATRRAVALLGLTTLLLTACATPQSRVPERSAAFQALTPADQKLALAGEIRKGFSRDAVRIAWGEPTEVHLGRETGEPLDCWLYTHTYSGITGGYYGAARGLVYSPQAHRYHYDGDDFYEAPPYIRPFGPPQTVVPYRKAFFDGDRVVAFTVAVGDSDSDANGSAGASRLHPDRLRGR